MRLRALLWSETSRLWVVLASNLALVAGLVFVGVTAHSVGVFAEGADYLADAAAIGVSLLAIGLSRRAPSAHRPEGYPRATRYAALVNAGWLLVLSVLVAAGAADRLIGGVRQVHGLPVLIVSAVAAVVMLAGALLLGGEMPGDEFVGDEVEREEDLNMQAVLLDTAADAVAAGGVAITGAIIYATGGLYWLDPVVALVIAVVIGYHAARLIGRIRVALAPEGGGRPEPTSGEPAGQS